MRSLAAGALQRAGAVFVRALLAAPRRQIDLPRFTRRRRFRNLHDESVTWLDSHFELIEHGAPWLHRVGRDVWDCCTGRVSNPFLRLEPGPGAHAGCRREVTTVYGFNGQLSACLRSLDQAMPPAGWEMAALARGQSWAALNSTDLNGTEPADALTRHRTRWMTDRQVNLNWRPGAALGYPPSGPRTPPWREEAFTPSMRVSWSSRGQETGWQRDPNKTRTATRNYFPLEVSESGVPELLDEALARYEHALTVTIDLGYYVNRNAAALRHRMPRYLLPTRE